MEEQPVALPMRRRSPKSWVRRRMAYGVSPQPAAGAGVLEQGPHELAPLDGLEVEEGGVGVGRLRKKA